MAEKEKRQEINQEGKRITRPVIYVQRLSDGEHFAEAVIVGGIPAFIVRNKDAIFTTDKIEFEDKIVKPLPAIAYLNKPYSFKIGEVEQVIEQAKKETLDSSIQEGKINLEEIRRC